MTEFLATAMTQNQDDLIFLLVEDLGEFQIEENFIPNPNDMGAAE